MDKKAPEIVRLRQDIEDVLDRKMHTPSDFEFLAGAVWQKLHETISPTTLKRLWGYLDGANVTRHSTLHLLSRFLDYANWDAYLDYLSSQEGNEVDALIHEGVHSSQLIPGDQVEVAWLPNRICLFKYLGDNLFIVEQSSYIKLQKGDIFFAYFFFLGYPLYATQLHRKEQIPTPSTHLYVFGKHGGLTNVRRIQ